MKYLQVKRSLELTLSILKRKVARSGQRCLVCPDELATKKEFAINLNVCPLFSKTCMESALVLLVGAILALGTNVSAMSEWMGCSRSNIFRIIGYSVVLYGQVASRLYSSSFWVSLHQVEVEDGY